MMIRDPVPAGESPVAVDTSSGSVSMEISQAEYDRIAEEIASEDSVVGIDAKKTHVMILHALRDVQQRLERLERRLDAAEGPQR
jgi:hypothetical protein